MSISAEKWVKDYHISKIMISRNHLGQGSSKKFQLCSLQCLNNASQHPQVSIESNSMGPETATRKEKEENGKKRKRVNTQTGNK